MLQKIILILVYLIGFIVFAVGIALSIKSNLGVTATTSLPLALSIVSNTSVGSMIAIMGLVYVILQILILKKEFKLINIGQLLFGSISGFFIDIALLLLTNVTPANYTQQFILMMISIPIISLGLTLIVSVNLLPSPTEGFVLAITKVSNKQFPKVKVIVDIMTLALAVGLYLIYSKNITGIREGTVLNALLNGILMGFFSKQLRPILRKFGVDKFIACL